MDRPPGLAVTTGISTVETHVSTLFFTADRVFKLKKSVRSGFLDFTTAAARRDACRREVELNRRLSPDVYLGVADLTMDGEDLDHFVVMQRMPPERRLAELLDDARVDTHLGRLADLLARFHAAAARGPEIDAAASPASVRELWRTGHDQLQPFTGTVLAADDVDRMWMLAAEFVDGRGGLIEARVEAGRACDGHGDLLAEDIFCMDDGPRVLDCLEFDDQLRYGDVLADVAFLAMDLERLGRPDLGTLFLRLYQDASGDSWPEALAHFHLAYRAHVRSKVACLRQQQGDDAATEQARTLHSMALAHLERARGRLVLVGGAPGTGKTTLARNLAQAIGAVHLSTDALRDQVVPADAGPAGHLHTGRYAPDRVGAVYDELLARADRSLRGGERVVLDASWSTVSGREEARRIARAASVPLTEICCVVPDAVARERIEHRSRRGGDSSEVTPVIAGQLAAQREPWPEAAVVDTSSDPEASLRVAVELLGEVRR